MDWYLDALKTKYMTFGGRARRAEFWWFTLVSSIVSFILACADIVFGIAEMTGGIAVLSALYSLGVLLPTGAVMVRRLQDAGRSFWFALVSLIPVVGPFALLYVLVRDSEPGSNRWGANPKGSRAPEMAQAA